MQIRDTPNPGEIHQGASHHFLCFMTVIDLREVKSTWNIYRMVITEFTQRLDTKIQPVGKGCLRAIYRVNAIRCFQNEEDLFEVIDCYRLAGFHLFSEAGGSCSKIIRPWKYVNSVCAIVICSH